jgi:hypothetical protein
MLIVIQRNCSTRRIAVNWSPIVSTQARTRVFESEELRCLQRLRWHYQREPDIFAKCELERLRFMRWLLRTGRLHVGWEYGFGLEVILKPAARHRL